MDRAPQNSPQNTPHPAPLSGTRILRLAHRISDVVSGVRIQLAKRWNFTSQTIAYQGYGSTGWVRVLGRVLLTKNPPPGSWAEHAARNGNQNVRGWRAFTSVPMQFVEVEITIDGVTREGIGTGKAISETGIKKAEHDALKRAAVKFGIARELYKKEFDSIEQSDEPQAYEAQANNDPVAKSLGDMVTARQLGMLRAIAREANLDAERECSQLMRCGIDELSKSAASDLIEHLQNLQRITVPFDVLNHVNIAVAIPSPCPLPNEIRIDSFAKFF